MTADVHEQRCADVRVKRPSNNVYVMDVTETLPAFVPIVAAMVNLGHQTDVRAGFPASEIVTVALVTA